MGPTNLPPVGGYVYCGRVIIYCPGTGDYATSNGEVPALELWEGIIEPRIPA